MKRSEINGYIEHAKEFIAKHNFHLPPFAYWSPEKWKSVGVEAGEIRTRGLGWDVTDFGSGRFEELGLLLFTMRNGKLSDAGNRKIYAEKLLIVRENQITPWHFHFVKTEDIINRGAGRLVCELYNSTKEGKFAETEVEVAMDGVLRRVLAGGAVTLDPGESITLTPGMYHMFYCERGRGIGLIGEVSSVNDDATDNRFYEPLGRYAKIEEDAAPVHLLCTEYPGGSGGSGY